MMYCVGCCGLARKLSSSMRPMRVRSTTTACRAYTVKCNGQQGTPHNRAPGVEHLTPAALPLHSTAAAAAFSRATRSDMVIPASVPSQSSETALGAGIAFTSATRTATSRAPRASLGARALNGPLERPTDPESTMTVADPRSRSQVPWPAVIHAGGGECGFPPCVAKWRRRSSESRRSRLALPAWDGRRERDAPPPDAEEGRDPSCELSQAPWSKYSPSPCRAGP